MRKQNTSQSFIHSARCDTLSAVGPGRFQPYIRYETVDVDDKNDTDFWSGGFNYYLKGHNCKLTADYMYVDPHNDDKDDRNIFTFQFTVGF